MKGHFSETDFTIENNLFLTYNDGLSSIILDKITELGIEVEIDIPQLATKEKATSLLSNSSNNCFFIPETELTEPELHVDEMGNKYFNVFNIKYTGNYAYDNDIIAATSRVYISAHILGSAKSVIFYSNEEMKTRNEKESYEDFVKRVKDEAHNKAFPILNNVKASMIDSKNRWSQSK